MIRASEIEPKVTPQWREGSWAKQAVINRCLGILLGVASKRATITYDRLASLLEMNIGWSRDRAELGMLLADVANLSQAEWGITAPVIVVAKGSNMPSGDPDRPSGFWAWATAHGMEWDEPEVLIVNEQRKVFNFATKAFKK